MVYQLLVSIARIRPCKDAPDTDNAEDQYGIVDLPHVRTECTY